MPEREDILRSMERILKPAGFNRHGTTFHRQRGNNFIDTVNLQAGVGAVAGKDTVNLGIYVPEIAHLLDPVLLKTGASAFAVKRPKEYECSWGTRLWRLAYRDSSALGLPPPPPEGSYLSIAEGWFDRMVPEVNSDVASLLLSHGVPYFDLFLSLSGVADRIRQGRLRSPQVRPELQAAVFLIVGSLEEARAVLREWHSDNPRLMESTAQKLGIDL